MQGLVIHYRLSRGHEYQFPWEVAPLIYVLAALEGVEHCQLFNFFIDLQILSDL